MSDMAIQQLLAQMRTLAAQIEPGAGPAATQGPGFGGALEQAMRSVNDQQVRATDLAASLEAGAPGLDVSQVMIEVQKAGVAFKAMTEVRNRLVSAYQEIMNMPV
ncbi:MAG: flagellar hook-basal body complex protein FliE [Steroidobacteraceae bacterium]